MGEQELLADFIARARRHHDPKTLLGPGDDAAVIEPTSGLECITSDQFIENRHFRHRWISPEALAGRCLAATISDLAAMGAVPRWVTLSLSLGPNLGPDWLSAFADGFGQVCESWQLDLIGGDLGRADLTSISLTAGGIAKKGRFLIRHGAAPDDGIWVSGGIGAAAACIDYLERGGNDRKMIREFYQAQHRVLLGLALNHSGIASSCCDISDGLTTSIHSLFHKGAPGALLDLKRIPLSPLAGSISQHLACSTRHWLLNGGEDYELLFTVPPRREEAISDLSEALDISLTRIGTMAANPGLITTDGRVLEAAGWDPFREA